MPAPYSMVLRRRAVAAAREGEFSRAAVARQFRISERTLYHWLELEERRGTLAPRAHGGGQRPIIDAAALEILRRLVEANNDRTLEEYTRLFEEKAGILPSTSAMDRALRRGGITRKKVAEGERARAPGRCGRARGVSPRERRHRSRTLRLCG